MAAISQASLRSAAASLRHPLHGAQLHNCHSSCSLVDSFHQVLLSLDRTGLFGEDCDDLFLLMKGLMQLKCLSWILFLRSVQSNLAFDCGRSLRHYVWLGVKANRLDLCLWSGMVSLCAPVMFPQKIGQMIRLEEVPAKLFVPDWPQGFKNPGNLFGHLCICSASIFTPRGLLLSLRSPCTWSSRLSFV